jgi:hypothetical protein
VYAVPVEWVAVFPKFDPLTQYLQGDIVLGYEKYWIRINVSASGKSFSEATRKLNGLTAWEQKISLRLNWQSGPQDVRLQNMTNHRWIFLIREAGTAIYYVVGKPPTGAEVNFEYQSETGTVTNIDVSFQSIHRAPLYTGVNRALCRIVDVDGNFLVDSEGNYLATYCDMVAPADPSAGEFANSDFASSDFYVSNT